MKEDENEEENEGKWVDEFCQHLQKRLKILEFSEYDIFNQHCREVPARKGGDVRQYNIVIF